MNKLTLLARAEKNGEPVHLGLRVECPGEYDEEDCKNGRTGGNERDSNGMRKYPFVWKDDEYECERCVGNAFIPNPDPMALIAAAQAQGWNLEFVSHGGIVNVTDDYVPNQHIKQGRGSDNQSALEDALFQATEALEPDNWAKCPACGETMNPGGNPYFSIGGNEMPDGSDCPDCDGAGIVLLEAQDE